MNHERTAVELYEQYKAKKKPEALDFINELGKSNPELAIAVLELVTENNKKGGSNDTTRN